MPNDKKFAVLIDADNISEKYIKVILDEISNDGTATYKRIYGDWTKPAFAQWKKALLEHSITPMQQYGYTTGKNATDSAMIIDAMDILYSGNVDGFCLVSSDSDFTRLASRLRESGMDVVGMGEQKTPKAFISACNKFKYLDILAGQIPLKHENNQENEKNSAKKSLKVLKNLKGSKQERLDLEKIEKEDNNTEKASEEQMTSLETIRRAIATIVEENSDEDEWVFIGDIGNRLTKRYPDFDVRNYGFNKLTPFIKSLDLFEIRSVANGSSNNKLVYVKEKGEIK
ncbi:NYN domain-containing protein [Sinanaerobacter sp. ZZT-01]|uniref:NYN domain-containing protein n=1 Tax=Sinanaerobacter sp. ZZT-01 TaxID=3111540 RepID=UPI002D765CE9|nr:NYN domain-containing protein [Sinanaerobacter sp. ZZT-01]WRR93717.1 NYN domain-containing protein [Sinanaerobacter sp. ZZT-01]